MSKRLELKREKFERMCDKNLENGCMGCEYEHRNPCFQEWLKDEEKNEEKKERIELVKVTSENIKEVAQNIADTMVIGGENNVWEAVNTMVHVSTPNEVIECLYKMVSNLVDCTAFTISNPFIEECEEVQKAFEEVACSNQVSNMKRIKALLMSKEVDGKLFRFKDTTMCDTDRVETMIVHRLDKSDIHIFRIDNTYGVHMYAPYSEVRNKSEDEIIEWLDNEIC